MSLHTAETYSQSGTSASVGGVTMPGASSTPPTAATTGATFSIKDLTMNDHSGFRKRSLYRRNSADGTKNVCINLTLQDPILVRANVYEPPIPVNKNTKLYHSTATCAPGYHPKVVLWISKENQGRWGEVSSYMDSYHGKQCPQGITWHRVPMTGSKCDDHLEKHFWAYDLMDHLLYAQEWNKDKPKHLLQFDDQWAKTANTNLAQVDPATDRQVDIMDYTMTGDKMEDAPHVKAQWNLLLDLSNKDRS